jgi:hypothetical protein
VENENYLLKDYLGCAEKRMAIQTLLHGSFEPRLAWERASDMNERGQGDDEMLTFSQR